MDSDMMEDGNQRLKMKRIQNDGKLFQRYDPQVLSVNAAAMFELVNFIKRMQKQE